MRVQSGNLGRWTTARALFAFLICSITTLAYAVPPIGQTKIIAVTGQPVFELGGFTAVGNAFVNDKGQVSFVGSVWRREQNVTTLFRYDQGGIVPIATSYEDHVSGGDGQLIVIQSVGALNEKGQVAFGSQLFQSPYRNAQLLGDGNSITPIALGNEVFPGGEWDLHQFGVPALNDRGQVAFVQRIGGRTGILRSDGTNVVTIVQTSMVAPDGAGTFHDIEPTFFRQPPPSLNELGQVAFWAEVVRPDRPTRSLYEGIFRGDESGLTEIARSGQLAPDGNGTLDVSQPGYDYIGGGTPMLNDVGQVAFIAHIDADEKTDDGIFVGDGSSLVQVARSGDAPPDGNGQFDKLGGSDENTIGLNNHGQVVFQGYLRNTAGGVKDNNGIFRWNGDIVEQLAREGQLAPDGNGRFSGFKGPVILFVSSQHNCY
jgi:hypothetical protein